MNFEQKFISVLSMASGCPDTKLTLDSNMGDLGIDSLDIVEVVMELEDTFQVEIDDAPNEVRTVGDLLAHVKASVSENHPQALEETYS